MIVESQYKEHIERFVAGGGKVTVVPYGKKGKNVKVKEKPDVTLKTRRDHVEQAG